MRKFLRLNPNIIPFFFLNFDPQKFKVLFRILFDTKLIPYFSWYFRDLLCFLIMLVSDSNQSSQKKIGYLGILADSMLRDFTPFSCRFRNECIATCYLTRMEESMWNVDVFFRLCIYPFFVGVNGNRCSESATLLEKYKIGKVIGDGNFAVVKECVDR